MKDDKRKEQTLQEEKKQAKSTGKSRKILLRCGLVLAGILLLAAVVHVIFLCVNKATVRKLTEGEQGSLNAEQLFTELEENHEEITFDRKKGVAFVNNEMILMVDEGVERSDLQAILDTHHGEITDAMEDIGFYRVEFEEEYTLKKLEKLGDRLTEYEEIREVYVNPVVDVGGDDGAKIEEKTPVYPKDPWLGDEWDIKVPGGANWGMEAIRAPKAWGYLDGLNVVKVGIIDHMVNTDHEDLSGTCFLSVTDVVSNASFTQQIYPSTYAPSDHGSHVAGIISAKWNGTGVSGVLGDKVDLYYSTSCSVKDGYNINEYYDAYNFVKAIKVLLDEGVQCINISMNTSRLIGYAASHGNQNAINHLTTQAGLAGSMLNQIVEKIEAENGKDFVICVAAGNNNSTKYYKDDAQVYGYKEAPEYVWEVNEGEYGGAEAKYNNFLNLIETEAVKNRIIVVGSVGIDEEKSTKKETRYRYSEFSNIGERVDIVAPGESVYSCFANGYDYKSGTSMSTPFVTAVAGMVFAANPDLSGPEVKQIVCVSTYGRYYYENGNSGLLDASVAVRYALETVDHSVGRVLQQSTSDGLDLCFLVDTTGSMEDDIDNTKENMAKILESLTQKGVEYRIAIVDYRDFGERTGNSNDYPAKVQLSFSDNSGEIMEAINGLTLGFGGDVPETVYSGFAAALGLGWRPTAKKAIIVLGDAEPLDPEPNTGYTYDRVVAALYDAKIGIDDQSDERVLGAGEESLMNVYSIGTEAGIDAIDFFSSISEATGGAYTDVADATEVSGAIVDSIEMIEIEEPINVALNFGQKYANDSVEIYKDGEFLYEFKLDEKGSFKLDDVEADRYEWKIPEMAASGQFKVKEGKKKVNVEGEQPWYGFALTLWQKNRVELILGVLGVAAVLAIALLAVKKVKEIKATDESAKEAETVPFTEETKTPDGLMSKNETVLCLNCGKPMEPGAKFCGNCGTKIE